MKVFYSIFFSLLALCSTAQKQQPSGESLSSELLPPMQQYRLSSSATAENLEAVITEIKSQTSLGEGAELILSSSLQSKTLTHYRFKVLVNSVRVFGAEVHAAVDHNNRIRLLQAPVLASVTEEGHFPAEAEAQQIKNNLGAETVKNTEEVWVYNADEMIKALRVELTGPETLHREVLLAHGEVLYNNDLHKHLSTDFAGPNDTTVNVRVFDPDPLTSAGENYGGSYTDNNDQNTGSLNTQRQQKTTTFTYENGEFRAENDFVKISEFSAPTTARATSASAQFNYTRDKAQFEDVNVVYHITQFVEHLQNLGYSNLSGYQIEVDAHALNGADQSFFSTSVYPYRLYFGEGGVDDAEDADVILHEFGHAVLHEAAPSGSKDVERKCIEEAICDYFAVSYSRTKSMFNAHQVFNWDGHNEFWPGRDVSSSKNYLQADFKNGNYYAHTDLFASVLLQLYDQLGRNTTDQLVLEAIFNLTANSNMPDFAEYMLLSDSLLNNGANQLAISTAFYDRDIISQVVSLDEHQKISADIKLLNTYGFTQGESVTIDSEVKLKAYQLYNIKGQLVASGNLEGQKKADLNFDHLQGGMYLLKLSTQQNKSTSFKLMRHSY